MNYPKVLYKGKHYTDYAQMGRDVHSNVIEKRMVTSEEEETGAVADGFGPLGDLIDERIGSQSGSITEPMKRRGRPPLNRDAQ